MNFDCLGFFKVHLSRGARVFLHCAFIGMRPLLPEIEVATLCSELCHNHWAVFSNDLFHFSFCLASSLAQMPLPLGSATQSDI